jgi:hypothetical protein
LTCKVSDVVETGGSSRGPRPPDTVPPGVANADVPARPAGSAAAPATVAACCRNPRRLLLFGSGGVASSEESNDVGMNSLVIAPDAA